MEPTAGKPSLSGREKWRARMECRENARDKREDNSSVVPGRKRTDDGWMVGRQIEGRLADV